MIIKFYIFLFYSLIDNTAWLSNPKFTRFANIVCNAIVVILDLIALIIMLPFALLELIFGTIVWVIQLAVYKKPYRKSFAQFFKLVDSDMKLNNNYDYNDIEEN